MATVEVRVQHSLLGQNTSRLFMCFYLTGLWQAALFAALKRTCMVPKKANWQQLQYSRCGRTDKGVSALGQVCTRRQAPQLLTTPLPSRQRL